MTDLFDSKIECNPMYRVHSVSNYKINVSIDSSELCDLIRPENCSFAVNNLISIMSGSPRGISEISSKVIANNYFFVDNYNQTCEYDIETDGRTVKVKFTNENGFDIAYGLNECLVSLNRDVSMNYSDYSKIRIGTLLSIDEYHNLFDVSAFKIGMVYLGELGSNSLYKKENETDEIAYSIAVHLNQLQAKYNHIFGRLMMFSGSKAKVDMDEFGKQISFDIILNEIEKKMFFGKINSAKRKFGF